MNIKQAQNRRDLRALIDQLKDMHAAQTLENKIIIDRAIDIIAQTLIHGV